MQPWARRIVAAAVLTVLVVGSLSRWAPRPSIAADGSSLWSRHAALGGGSCRTPLAPAPALTTGDRALRLDSYDTCGCETLQKTSDPFVSSSGSVRAPEMALSLDGAGSGGPSVLLLSHGRLQALDLTSRSVTVLHHQPGLRIRGVFLTRDSGVDNAAAPALTYVLLTTPSLKHESRFLGVDGKGRTLYDIPATGTRDGHDAVRHGDEVFVVSTGTGEVRIYDAAQQGRFPFMRAVAAAGDTRRAGAAHINTVGVSPSTVWVLHHNQGRGSAEVHVLERFAERSLEVYPDVGKSSHGLAFWGEQLVVLDSQRGRVLAVHRLRKTTRVVWICPDKCFVKGLAVVGDTAVVGVAPPQRRMDRMAVNSSVVGLSLTTGLELWRMQPAGPGTAATATAQPLATFGLLNHIVPFEPAQVTRPALMSLQQQREVKDSEVEGFRMLGALSIFDLRRELQLNWEEAWTGGMWGTEHLFAPGLNARFPGVQHLRLLFSTGERIESLGGLPTDTCVVLPGWRRFSPVVYPLLQQLMETRLGYAPGSWEPRLFRVQLNSMPPGSEVKAHSDVGSYAHNSHRIHVPLIVPQCVQFEQKRPATATSWSEVPFKEGEAFEVNNLLPHHVQQCGPYERVTMIIDLADKPCKRTIEVGGPRDCPSFTQRWWEAKRCTKDQDVDLAEWRSIAAGQ